MCSAGFPRPWPESRRDGRVRRINGLTIFYEIRGAADPGKVPVVLLHGAISATGTSFGPLPDLLAQTHQVIAVEQQGHGRTAGIDRPLSVQAMAADTLALLANLGIGQATCSATAPARASL
jgi:pimeloyl-ACP methyl ester carboxylesterase